VAVSVPGTLPGGWNQPEVNRSRTRTGAPGDDPFATKLLTSGGHQTLAAHALRVDFYALIQVLESGLLVAMLRYMTARRLSVGLPEQTVTSVSRQSYHLMAGFGLSIPVFFTYYAWVLWIAVPLAARLWLRFRHRTAPDSGTS
jgi:hypothetical protein